MTVAAAAVAELWEGSGAEPDELAWNLRLGAAYCRLRYLFDPRALPEPGDVSGFAALHKRAYNSALGATSQGDFERAWQRHCARIYPT